MSDREKIYKNIIDTINTAIHVFWCEYGREPNKIIVGTDVFDFLVAYSKELLVYFAEDNVNRLMGMDIDIVYNKKGFIEVGIMQRVPYSVNTEWKGAEGHG